MDGSRRNVRSTIKNIAFKYFFGIIQKKLIDKLKSTECCRLDFFAPKSIILDNPKIQIEKSRNFTEAIGPC